MEMPLITGAPLWKVPSYGRKKLLDEGAYLWQVPLYGRCNLHVIGSAPLWSVFIQGESPFMAVTP